MEPLDYVMLMKSFSILDFYRILHMSYTVYVKLRDTLQYCSLLGTDNPQLLIKRYYIVSSIAQLSFNEWEFLQFQLFIK